MRYTELALGIIAVLWTFVCILIVVKGRKYKNVPNAKFEKVPIILGLGVAGAIVLLAVIGWIFF